MPAEEHALRGEPIQVRCLHDRMADSLVYDEVLVSESGAIVQKGQPLFKVTPDEKVVHEEPAAKAARVRSHTDDYVAQLAR